MKNSNKYLLAALLVLLASLTAYNMGLRAEYRTGNYRDPLRAYLQLGFTNFSEVAVPASSVVEVKITPGPFGVRLNPQAAEYVHVRQQGQCLVVTADFPKGEHFLGRGEAVVISCPRLTAVSADAVYQLEGQPHYDYDAHHNGLRTVRVVGFRQDSLSLRQDRASRIELADNQLIFLRVVAGPSAGSHALLQLAETNRIAAANLAIEHQSELVLNNVVIPRLRYHVADSARLTLTGAALASLRK